MCAKLQRKNRSYRLKINLYLVVIKHLASLARNYTPIPGFEKHLTQYERVPSENRSTPQVRGHGYLLPAGEWRELKTHPTSVYTLALEARSGAEAR